MQWLQQYGEVKKMKLFDTHSHYNDEQFDEDREEIIKKIFEAGVENTVVVGDNVENSKKAIELAKKYDFIYAAVGVHPNEIAENEEEISKQISQIKGIVNKNEKIVAIGEIGLDNHWVKDQKELQRYAFLEQIKLANELNLPIVIHSRDAIMETIEILKGKVVPEKKGILHCCQLNRDLVKAGLEAGFYISFAGAVTFKSSKNANEIIGMVPNDRILIETDCPYLSPEPNRGKRNDSRNVKYIAEKIASVKEMPVEEVARITYENGKRIFGMK